MGSEETAPKRALIIEDDHSYTRYLEKMLEKVGFFTESVDNGIAGMKLLRDNRYDLLLLDLVMPQMDGDSVLQVLKKRNDTTPVIVISAYLTKNRILRLAQSGVRAFLTKPFKVEQFMQALDKVYPFINGNPD